MNPIHEGANGIHANDLVARQIRLDGGQRVASLIARIRRTVERAAEAARFDRPAKRLDEAVHKVAHVTAALSAECTSDRDLSHAYPYLEVVGAVVIGWMLLDQTLVAAGQQGQSPAFVTAKVASAAY